MMRLAVFAALAMAACASQPPRAPFSLTALLLDAPAYVAARYERDEMPAALIADLTAEEFQCQSTATGGECGRARHAFASCWDVINVRIEAHVVTAESNRRCMGAQQ